MRTVKGLRAEELLFERLQPGIRFRGKVHSIFSSTMNLMEEGGRLWTVSIERQMYLPGTLEISGKINFEEYHDLLGKPVHLASGMLIFGHSFQVDLSDLLVRKPPERNAIAMGPGNPKDNLKETLKELRRKGKRGGCLSFFLPGSPEGYLEKAFQERILQMKRTGDFRKILGLGLGLTPSGDDFALGFMAMASYLQESFVRDTAQKLKTLLEQGTVSTTEVSLQMLHFGKEGRFPGDLTDFCEEVLYGNDPEKRNHTMKKLLNIGSISGTDMASGALFALELNLEQQCGGNDDKKS